MFLLQCVKHVLYNRLSRSIITRGTTHSSHLVKRKPYPFRYEYINHNTHGYNYLSVSLHDRISHFAALGYMLKQVSYQ